MFSTVSGAAQVLNKWLALLHTGRKASWENELWLLLRKKADIYDMKSHIKEESLKAAQENNR